MSSRYCLAIRKYHVIKECFSRLFIANWKVHVMTWWIFLNDHFLGLEKTTSSCKSCHHQSLQFRKISQYGSLFTNVGNRFTITHCHSEYLRQDANVFTINQWDSETALQEGNLCTMIHRDSEKSRQFENSFTAIHSDYELPRQYGNTFAIIHCGSENSRLHVIVFNDHSIWTRNNRSG